MIEPRNFDIWKADVLISTESNTNQFALVRNGLLLRGQRALYVLHCDYSVNWGEPVVSCHCKYGKQLQKGECQKDSRQSDSFIVLKKLGNANEGRELHNNGLSEDTSTVLRDGGIDGNEIRKNSRNIGKFAETRVHIVVSSNQ